MKKADIEKSYKLAKEQYASIGVDTDAVIEQMDNLVISLHCWQTDDVGGFEKAGAILGGGGIQATGNFPGKARTIEQMRADLDKVFAILPGKQRLSLHAIYGEFGGKIC
jgi:L-rhamnose isomerase